MGRDKAVELGVIFRSSVGGYVRGVEFYKSVRNTGPHVGSLWSKDGKRLARARFTRETRSGWQRVLFDSPVRIRGGVDYVASYHTTAGRFAADRKYFQSPRIKAPLRSRAGVYSYGPSSFPSRSLAETNYYVDVVFSTRATSAAPPPVAARASGPTGPTGQAPSVPASSGWPNASNTGVPPGTVLTPFTGRLTISTPGAVVDAMDVSGCIVITANNVTVKRTRVRGDSCVNAHQIDTGDGQYTGIVLEDVEVDGLDISSYGAGIGNSGFTCRRCNIHNVGQGVHLDENGGVEYSFIHDLYGTGDPATSGSHNEPIFAGGGSNLVIRGNELRANWSPASSGGGMSAALALYGWNAAQNNVLVEANRFSSVEGFCAYGGATHGNPNPTNVRFLNNRFVRGPSGTCGDYGPVTAYKSGSGNEWSGNVWDDTGATINAG